ncbi:metalloprotease TldD [Pseudorhizobium pelagicum]|uniref:Protease TldD n=1 Tax=Pseudorhizobium pelagicum TaxID=1509405 RepID=A0A922P485_9HYPH|nr:metalloprotease TldD [Pseudorhizobium pelagicum]KEQ09196.1 protease TldD [Pseudorhizobium pelagicum]KEQ10984.1 protease TldD [Pseudorhizobium pelagicum]|tara:strand:+ start:14000 stop:15415 length:1416 start_codon:yes stop_codon:yes gene_type:complete
MTNDLLNLFDCDEARLRRILAETLNGADDGELFVEHAQSESLTFDNGRLKGGSFNTDQGFGLRAVAGEAVGYAHSGELSAAALDRAADAVRAVTAGHSGSYAAAPQRSNKKYYGDENPIGQPSFEEKVRLLTEIDAYLRGKDPKVRQVTATAAASWQVVDILRADGHRVHDIRPMTRVNISVVVGDGDRQESGSFGTGGRMGFGDFVASGNWQTGADEALRQALVNLDAIDAPAGTMDVVLGNGWPGVMLHEAVGHGLEGDFNRKKTSAFAGLLGEMVASPNVTVVDDGTIDNRRGSITVDDEGTPSAYNVLIEKGKLVGYMQDRQNARLMGMAPTGNGRRQGYSHVPMPRMTNTYMLSGEKTPEEIIASVKKGIYAVSFGGGQVDITSGKFVFGCTEAYMIEDGKIGPAIKGAMLIGNGPEAMQRVSMVGNDTQLDTGIGNCGKGGQWVPVGVGQPHLRMDQVTVGGTRT